MDEFKGTKGPWKVQHSISKNAWNVICSALGGRFKIARLPYGEFSSKEIELKENAEQYANAKLVAKAPEMLELLKHLIDQDMMSHEADAMAQKLIKEATS